MTFSDAVKTCLGKYVVFSGRAARSEYWWFALFVFLGVFILSIVDHVIWGDAEDAIKLLAPIFQLVTFLPLLAAGWRRLHDTGRPGWYLLLPMLFSVGFALALIGGVVAFGAIEAAGMPQDELRGPAALLGLTGIMIAWIVQFVLALLMLWWLTRPSEPGANAYGAQPV